jgi:hypothetical protein
MGNKKTDPLEIAINTIVLLLGFILIIVSYRQVDFYQNLLLSLGTNLIVVTVVFIIFEAFRRREQTGGTQAQNSKELDPKKKDFPSELKKKLASRSVNLQHPNRGDYGDKDEK